MKLPTNISGSELIKAASKLGYHKTRQVGSHIRLTTTLNGTHHITIPNHNPIKVGTLTAIIRSIATHFNISKEEVLIKLFQN